MKVASLKVFSSWRFRQRKAYSMLVSTEGAGIADEMLMKYAVFQAYWQYHANMQ